MTGGSTGAVMIMCKTFQRFNRVCFLTFIICLWICGGLKSVTTSQIGKTTTTVLTFYSNLSCGFDHAQRGDGNAGVVGRFTDVSNLQYVASQWHLFLLGQFDRAHCPLDVGHWGAHCHTCQVDAAAWHHLLVSGWNGESGWDPSHCENEEQVKGVNRYDL